MRAADADTVASVARRIMQEAGACIPVEAAVFLQATGRRGTALDAYRRLIAAGDQASIPQAATILAGIGRFDEALDDFARSATHRGSDHHLGLMFAARRFEEAAQSAQETFAASARSVADYRRAIDFLVRSGHPERAVRLIAEAPADIRSNKTIAWCAELYGFLLARIETVKIAPDRSDNGPRDLLISLVAWGAAYAERVADVVLASLAAPENLPSLAKTRAVRLRIYTDLVGRMILQRAPSVRFLQRHIAIEYEILPAVLMDMRQIETTITARYLLLGALSHLSVIEAGRAGLDVMLLGADCVYSSRFCTHIAELAAAGREVISVSVAFSANDSLLGSLEKWRQDAAISIASEDLVDLGFAHLHHRTQTACVDLAATRRAPSPAMLFFRHKDGLGYRKLGVDLTFLANAAIRDVAHFDYLTPDGEMPDRILPPDQWHRVHRVDDSRDAVLVELIEDHLRFPEIDGALTPQHVVAYADTYGFLNYMRHCFNYETRLHGRNPPPWPGDQDYAAFIAETKRLLFEL